MVSLKAYKKSSVFFKGLFFFKYIFIIAGLVKNKRLGTWSPHTSFCMKMNGIMYLSQCYLYWGFIYFALLIITFSYISESLCLLFFIKFLFLTKWQPFKNYEKCFSFHLKSSFHSQDIQIFVFLSSSLFAPVSHCFRGSLKVNLKVYDVINSLNKNLITICLISWEGKNVWDVNFVFW